MLGKFKPAEREKLKKVKKLVAEALKLILTEGRERAMVVGVTEHNITKLDDAEIPEIDLSEGGTTWTVPPGANGYPNGPTTAWKAMLDQLRAKTTRR